MQTVVKLEQNEVDVFQQRLQELATAKNNITAFKDYLKQKYVKFDPAITGFSVSFTDDNHMLVRSWSRQKQKDGDALEMEDEG